MFTICFDTICQGYYPITTDSGTPVSYPTEVEAQAEIESDPEFYEDCFVVPMSEIGHKTIYTGKEA